MSLHKVVLCCWKHGHKTEMAMTLKQEEILTRKLDTLKAVCPECRNAGLGNQPIFITEGRTVVNVSKVYRCTQGHISAVTPFTHGMLNVSFGPARESFVNIEGTIEELSELIDTRDISCHHVKDDGQQCDCKLEAIDDAILAYPTSSNFKTKTRVGDLWDSAGIEPVRPGHYDKQGFYQENKTERVNRERLKRMRDRNIPVDRHPGKRIDQPTDTNYKRRSKKEVNPERLRGPQ